MVEPWMTYKGVALFRQKGAAAYAYTTPAMSLDADGAPNAYHPRDIGLDRLANAGWPNGAWREILVVDPADPAQPYVQPDGPYAGSFLAGTALQDASRAATDPARHLDARSVPYIVFPRSFYALNGTGGLGDLAMVRDLSTGRVSAAIIGDIGPSQDPLGEVSIATAANLGGVDPNPRNGHGAPPGPFRYVVFPGSHANPKWPLTPIELERRAHALLATAGGWAAFDPP